MTQAHIYSYLNLNGKGHDFLEEPAENYIAETLKNLTRSVNKKKPMIGEVQISGASVTFCFAKFDANGKDAAGRWGLVYTLVADFHNMASLLESGNYRSINLFYENVQMVCERLINQVSEANQSGIDDIAVKEQLVALFRHAEQKIEYYGQEGFPSPQIGVDEQYIDRQSYNNTISLSDQSEKKSLLINDDIGDLRRVDRTESKHRDRASNASVFETEGRSKLKKLEIEISRLWMLSIINLMAIAASVIFYLLRK